MPRNTIQRALVLDAVNKLHNHPTANEVYETIVKEHPDISVATVYRNLNKLSDEGLIRKRIIPGTVDRFDHLCSNHYHARCKQCGRIFDVDMDYMPDLSDRIRDTHGFQIDSHDITFTGTCPDCLAKESQ